jgi:hypothetical protein
MNCVAMARAVHAMLFQTDMIPRCGADTMDVTIEQHTLGLLWLASAQLPGLAHSFGGTCANFLLA